jgi:hypothetical protein
LELNSFAGSFTSRNCGCANGARSRIDTINRWACDIFGEQNKYLVFYVMNGLILVTNNQGYWDMLRIYKHIKLQMTLADEPLGESPETLFCYSFSSYPGSLSSTDDYYTTSRFEILIYETLFDFNQ